MSGINCLLTFLLVVGHTFGETLPTLSITSMESAIYSSSENGFPSSTSNASASRIPSSSSHRSSISSSSSSASRSSSLPSLASSMQLAVKITPKQHQDQQDHSSDATATEHVYDEDDEYYVYDEDYDEEEKEGEADENLPLKEPHHRGPYFASTNTSTRVYLGSTATLECTVLDVTNESVSWLRLVDDMLELLTWGSHTYTTDDRYSLVQEMGDRWQRWQLVIRDARIEDEGQYRCQVATQPPMLMALILNITEPVTKVVDERGTDVADKHYNSGSMIELKCIIENVPFPHGPVTWRRGNTPLVFNTSRGGISVKGSKDSGYIRSRLYVANAAPSDAGVYSCWYGNYTSDNVTVHVIAGENSAAMQHDALPETPTSSSSFTNRPTLFTSSIYFIFLPCITSTLSISTSLFGSLQGLFYLKGSKETVNVASKDQVNLLCSSWFNKVFNVLTKIPFSFLVMMCYFTFLEAMTERVSDFFLGFLETLQTKALPKTVQTNAVMLR